MKLILSQSKARYGSLKTIVPIYKLYAGVFLNHNWQTYSIIFKWCSRLISSLLSLDLGDIYSRFVTCYSWQFITDITTGILRELVVALPFVKRLCIRAIHIYSYPNQDTLIVHWFVNSTSTIFYDLALNVHLYANVFAICLIVRELKAWIWLNLVLADKVFFFAIYCSLGVCDNF